MGEKTRCSRVFLTNFEGLAERWKVGEEVGRSEMNYRVLKKNIQSIATGGGGAKEIFWDIA